MLLNFDYDGVIANSSEQVFRIVAESQSTMGIGRPPVHSDFSEMEEHTFESWGTLMGIPQDRLGEFVGTVYRLQENSSDSPPLYPDITRVIKELALSHTITVISATSSKKISRVLTENTLVSSVSKVLGGETGLSKKERILSTCAEFDHSTNETFIIGDATSDIHAGRSAGVHTIAVAWGHQPVKMLQAEAPDHLIYCPSDLLVLFGV